MKKISILINFELGEDQSILDKLIKDGWTIQERSWYDAESGFLGKQLKCVYLEYFHKQI